MASRVSRAHTGGGGRHECFLWTPLRTGETPVLRLDGVTSLSCAHRRGWASRVFPVDTFEDRRDAGPTSGWRGRRRLACAGGVDATGGGASPFLWGRCSCARPWTRGELVRGIPGVTGQEQGFVYYILPNPTLSTKSCQILPNCFRIFREIGCWMYCFRLVKAKNKRI
jgi:hypothetical protein